MRALGGRTLVHCHTDRRDLDASTAYNTCEGQAGYDPDANLVLNDPGPQCIDLSDMGLLMSLFGLQATGAIRANFTWDAENRLTRSEGV